MWSPLPIQIVIFYKSDPFWCGLVWIFTFYVYSCVCGDESSLYSRIFQCVFPDFQVREPYQTTKNRAPSVYSFSRLKINVEKKWIPLSISTQNDASFGVFYGIIGPIEVGESSVWSWKIEFSHVNLWNELQFFLCFQWFRRQGAYQKCSLACTQDISTIK